MTIPLNELALAYELRQEGCCWKRIALGLGRDHEKLKQAVNYTVRCGFKIDQYGRRGPGVKRHFSLETLRFVDGLRRQKQRRTWAEIADILGTTPQKIFDCYRKARKKGLI